MSFSSWLRYWNGSLERRSALSRFRQLKPAARRFVPRPHLEALEDRLVLSPTLGVDQTDLVVPGGSTAVNTGTWSGSNVTLSASAGTVVQNADGTWSWSEATPGNVSAQSQVITVTAADGQGQPSQASFFVDSGNILQVTTTVDNGDNTNPIAGSLRQAILTADSQGGAVIAFAIPTTDPDYQTDPVSGASWFTIQPTSLLPDITAPVVIDGYSQPGASPNTLKGVGAIGAAPGDPSQYGDNAVLNVVLDGSLVPKPSTLPYPGLSIGGPGCVQGLVINNWTTGIFDGGDGLTVRGNFIGTDVSGTTTPPRSYSDWTTQAWGIIDGGSGDIGGTAPADRNLVSGFWAAGINGGAGTVVQGNFIGTDRTGTRTFDAGGRPLGSYVGILPGEGAQMLIGGGDPGAGNLISGNDYGIRSYYPLETLQIQGNFIGTDVTGTHTIGDPNQWTGNYFTAMSLERWTGFDYSVTGNLVTGNLISGNSAGSSGQGGFAGEIDQPVTFQDNYVGTDVTGRVSLSNQSELALGASNNTIDGNLFAGRGLSIGTGWPLGTDLSSGSTIQGNHFFDNPSGIGLRLGEFTSGNTVRDNDFTGQSLPIAVWSAQNQILHNTIHGNSLFGIYVQGSQNTISENSIYDNGDVAIFLANAANGGVSYRLYDPSFPDGNNDQAAPVLTAAYASSGGTIVTGTMAGAPNATFLLEFFANPAGDPEGRTFLGSKTVTTDPSGNFSVVLSATLSPDQGLVTATATDPNGNTSEFSAGVTATPLPPSSLSGVVWEDFNDDGQVDFGEQGISGVTVTLSGTDFLGNAVNLS